MKRIIAVAAISYLLNHSAVSFAAPGIDITATVGQWQADYSGDIGRNNTTATLNELGFSDDSSNVLSVTVEHILPFIPNVKIRTTSLDVTESSTLSRTFTFDNITFVASDDVTTTLDFSHQDLTFFYSPLDNWVHLDLGLTARRFDGEASIVGTIGSEKVDFDTWVPMFYGNARFELPLTGWFVNGELNTVSYDGNTLTDIAASVGYSSGSIVGFTAELGYRQLSIDADDLDSLRANIDIDGLYANIGLTF